MIKHIYGGSEYLIVSSNSGSQPYFNPSTPSAGLVRFNNSSLEAYDGTSWLPVANGSANVDLSAKAINIMRWAEQKMAEEEKYQQLAEKNAAVKIALDNLLQAQDHLKVTAHLAKEANETTS